MTILTFKAPKTDLKASVRSILALRHDGVASWANIKDRLPAHLRVRFDRIIGAGFYTIDDLADLSGEEKTALRTACMVSGIHEEAPEPRYKMRKFK